MLLHVLLAVTGTVTDASSRWQGDVIVTRATVRDASGLAIDVVQLGGTVDGVGMWFSHQPPLLKHGDLVSIDAKARNIIAVVTAAALPPGGGNAMYGVQRTARSGTALWRDGGCLELTYDSTTISPDTARVIDASFAAWSTAAAGCGQIIATSTRRPSPPATRDEMNTVRIRRDTWCNPGNAIEAPICYAKEASAVTRLLFIDDPTDANDGQILDADIELNGVDYVLLGPNETAAATTKPVIDLQAVATHEAGHALGLAHNCGTGTEAWPTDHAGVAVPACDDATVQVRAATMYFAVVPGDVGPRSIEATDVAGACELARELTCEVVVAGGCSTGGGGAGVWTLAVLLVLMRRRRWPSYDRKQPMAEAIPRRIQRFEVREHLGSGGMGAVYRAFDPQLERDVAIKVLAQSARTVPSELSADDTLDLRRETSTVSPDDLLREARMMARLSHPNVLPVYEVGLADGALFVVMEHIAGSDLATWLSEPRSTQQILDVFAQAGRGLAAAHASGIVHRDFKPANVLLGGDGRVRVADFGLSRLTQPAAPGMVRIDDGRGTPRYMAPELWHDAHATQKADVYAFCAALDHALGGEADDTADARDKRWREHGLSAPLRAALASGLAADPNMRTELTRVLDAIAGRPSRRRKIGIALGAVAGVAMIGATAFVLAGDDDVLACETSAPWFADRWSAAQRGKLEPEVGEAIDRKRKAIDDGLVAVCTAQRAGELTAQQAAERTSCLQRRALELVATVERVLVDAKESVRRVNWTGNAETCVTVVAPPILDLHAAEALWARFVRSDELAIPSKAVEHATELTAIEKGALQAGERELATRSQYTLGVELEFQDQLAAADEAYTRAYRGAIELRATNLAARCLLARATLASRRGDAAASKSLTQLALDLADKPSTTPFMRMEIYRGIARAQHAAGDYRPAIGNLQKALAIAVTLQPPEANIEHDLHIMLVRAFALSEGKARDAVAAANTAVARAKSLFGEKHANYGIALNALAFALRSAGDLKGALPIRKRALDLMVATLPPNHSRVVFQHADYAADLWASGASEEARKYYAAAVEQTEKNEMMAADRGGLLQMLAITTFDTGRHAEGLKLARDAYAATARTNGLDHPTTLETQVVLLDIELELGKLDEAERDYAMLEQAYVAKRADFERRLAVLRGNWGATLALRRGKPQAAEQLARGQLAMLDELKAADSDRRMIHQALGEALLAQHKAEAALAAFEQGRVLAVRAQERADSLALADIGIARAEAALGRRAAALERARAARAVLDKFPNQLIARDQADRLLAGR